MKTYNIILIIIGIGIIIWIIGTLLVVKNIEEPSYKVVENKKGYSIREYSNYIVAEVEVKGSQDTALNSGFKLLAGYIFGGNTKKQSIAMTAPVNDIKNVSEKIAMTIPVSETITDNNSRIIQFSMPSEFTLSSLPIPNDEQVKIREISGYKAAVLKYTGYANESKVEKMKQKLITYLNDDNIKINGEVISAQYNPPLSFPLLRRNEIIIPIE